MHNGISGENFQLPGQRASLTKSTAVESMSESLSVQDKAPTLSSRSVSISYLAQFER